MERPRRGLTWIAWHITFHLSASAGVIACSVCLDAFRCVCARSCCTGLLLLRLCPIVLLIVRPARGNGGAGAAGHSMTPEGSHHE